MSDSRDDNFLVAVFNNSADHIQFLKKQQWTITQYCLLLYAAIVAVFKIDTNNPLSGIERGALFATSAVLCVVGCILIFTFEESIKEHRKIIENIYETFSEEIKIAHAKVSSGSAPIDVPVIRFSLIASLIIGLVIIVWLLYRNTPLI